MLIFGMIVLIVRKNNVQLPEIREEVGLGFFTSRFIVTKMTCFDANLGNITTSHMITNIQISSALICSFTTKDLDKSENMNKQKVMN